MLEVEVERLMSWILGWARFWPGLCTALYAREPEPMVGSWSLN